MHADTATIIALCLVLLVLYWAVSSDAGWASAIEARDCACLQRDAAQNALSATRLEIADLQAMIARMDKEHRVAVLAQAYATRRMEEAEAAAARDEVIEPIQRGEEI